jgi:hypothetical protein
VKKIRYPRTDYILKREIKSIGNYKRGGKTAEKHGETGKRVKQNTVEQKLKELRPTSRNSFLVSEYCQIVMRELSPGPP